MRTNPRFAAPALFGARSVRRPVLPAAAFFLTLGLSACDLPLIARADAASGLSGTGMASASPAFSAVSPVSTLSAMAGGSAFSAKATSSATGEAHHAAGIADIEVLQLEKPDPAGNALLEVRFREDAKPEKDEIALTIDDRKTVLVRDAADPLKYVGFVDFDFAAFDREQLDRRKLVEQTGESSAVLFEGRQFLGKETLALDGASAQKAFVVLRRIRLPRALIAMPPSAVDPSRELFITDLSVVQDPTRTFDICNNSGNPNGAWTFKTLMTNMANQPLTGQDPALFVESWVRSWQVSHTINSFAVPARANIGPLVLNSWPRLADGRLNLDRSPFRLLAIVNRVDLRGNPVYGGSGGNAGEGRLVFGVVNRNANGGCSQTQFTVIFEYGVPISGCSAVQQYAQQWVNLGATPFGATFNTRLQQITDRFTTMNAAPGRPNNSALNQLRTNEIALASPWELREFVLPRGNGPLTIVSTQDTAHRATFQNSATVANYMNSAVRPVPLSWLGVPFLTGSSLNPSIADFAAWNGPGASNAGRHDVSLRSCDGCHGSEARANGNPFVAFPTPETNFVHITPRLPGQQSQLSKFLLGTGTLVAPSTFPKNDPINGAPQRNFGDLLRRQQDLANLMNTSCRTAGLAHALRFRPLDVVH